MKSGQNVTPDQHIGLHAHDQLPEAGVHPAVPRPKVRLCCCSHLYLRILATKFGSKDCLLSRWDRAILSARGHTPMESGSSLQVVILHTHAATGL